MLTQTNRNYIKVGIHGENTWLTRSVILSLKPMLAGAQGFALQAGHFSDVFVEKFSGGSTKLPFISRNFGMTHWVNRDQFKADKWYGALVSVDIRC